MRMGWDWRKHWIVDVLAAIALMVVFVVIGYEITNWWAFRDDAPDRGAQIVANDSFGDVANKIVYLDSTFYPNSKLDQGWTARDSVWFDNVSQGSDLLPYDFFLVIKDASGKLFRDNANMNRYRYLARHPTLYNPDGLPVGMVKDNYQGRNFMGFTCAACHTGQVDYNGTGIRIDGAPAMADMDTFITDLAKAVAKAQTDPASQQQFVGDVLALKDDYSSADQVKKDLQIYAVRLMAYRIVNRSDTTYGYARLDAFGRIYNQVLQYVMTAQDLKQEMDELVANGQMKQADLDACGFTKTLASLMNKPVLNGEDRDALMATLAVLGSSSFGGLKEVLYFRNAMYNPPNAPVSYPFVWDIPQHDYVQWNGIAANFGLGPIGRNTGEVVGVFGSMNWQRMDHWTLEGVISGQGFFNTHPINFSSSVDVHNLALIEDKLKSLRAPVWPQSILGKIDQAKAARGGKLFDQYCAACHAEIDRTDPARRIVAHMSAQDHIGTDAVMAVNGAGYTGHSGILRNEYVTVGPGALLLDKKAAVAALLTKAVTGVVATPDADKTAGRRFVEWAYDLIFSLRNNDIGASMKNGDYHPDTTASPLASVVAYKGRALDGIWATAPYLHNGSVPTLYDLLLPVDQRPAKFMVGSRTFDPKKVGFKSDGYAGFQYLTAMAGNSNAGHEYGTRDVAVTNADGTVAKNPDGSDKMLPALTDDQRWDLVEYLKSL
jgi:mono/diheme cytochrome c family protein